ncbi:MAG: hypothetical protein ACPGXY_00795 [Alphaproteobacteria bacterium]
MLRLFMAIVLAWPLTASSPQQNDPDAFNTYYVRFQSDAQLWEEIPEYVVYGAILTPREADDYGGDIIDVLEVSGNINSPINRSGIACYEVACKTEQPLDILLKAMCIDSSGYKLKAEYFTDDYWSLQRLKDLRIAYMTSTYVLEKLRQRYNLLRLNHQASNAPEAENTPFLPDQL